MSWESTLQMVYIFAPLKKANQQHQTKEKTLVDKEEGT